MSQEYIDNLLITDIYKIDHLGYFFMEISKVDIPYFRALMKHRFSSPHHSLIHHY